MVPVQPLVLAALTGVFTTALVLAERTGPRGRWVLKPLASAGFVATALALPILAQPHGAWLIAALVTCAVGDVLLLPEDSRPAFVAGMGAFGLGHALFALLFLRLGAGWWVLPGLLVVAPLAVGVWRRLAPHLGRLREPVRAYVSIITLMVGAALGLAIQSPGTRSALLAVAATLFFSSDLFVARQRFVTRAWLNRAVGLPLYYGAQLLFAYGFCWEAL